MLSQETLHSEISRASGSTKWLVDVFDQLPSTNDYLREIDAPADANCVEVCATDWQTAGHGRRGKSWSSQRGNMTFTLRQTLAQPASGLLGLSLVAGIAVVGVLRQHLGIQAQLKWPNDVLVAGQKLGGLLIELAPKAGEPSATHVMTGIGLNVRHQSEFEQLGIGATSLEKLACQPEPDRHALIAAISVAVVEAYKEFDAHGWSQFEARWREVDALFGQVVSVSPGQDLVGKACGVSATGALLISTSKGTEAVMAGEVSVRPV